MRKKILSMAILIIFISTSVLPVTSLGEEQAYFKLSIDLLNTNQATCSDDIYEIYEGQYIRLGVYGRYNPPDPTRHICLWGDNNTIPSGATLTPECNCGYGEVYSIFEWIPSVGQAGTYVIVIYLGETCYNPEYSFSFTIIVHPSGADNPPIVIINSPADETTVNNPALTITGYAEDDQELQSFGRRHEWEDGMEESSSTFPFPGPTIYNFSESFMLHEGWNRLTIYVTDSVGYNAEDQIIIYYEIPVNQPPYKPATPVGPDSGLNGLSYQYISYVSDPDGDQMEIMFDWGDGTNTSWIGSIASGTIVDEYHTYTTQGTFAVKVRARDLPGLKESVWSDSLVVSMPKTKDFMNPFLNFLENHPHLFPIIRLILNI